MNREYLKKRYNDYKEIKIECPYCERTKNVYDIFKHIKTNRCMLIQKHKFNDIELDDKKYKLLILIDKLRYNYRNDINDEII